MKHQVVFSDGSQLRPSRFGWAWHCYCPSNKGGYRTQDDAAHGLVVHELVSHVLARRSGEGSVRGGDDGVEFPPKVAANA